MNIQWRFNENRLVSFIKVNDFEEPFINIPPDKQYGRYYSKNVFRFYMQLKNPLFLNYTNIDLSTIRRKKFYFSNLANNNENDIHYLTIPVDDYAVGKNYLPGNLVADPASGNIYEAIKKHAAKKKTGLTDATLWTPKASVKLPKAVKEHIIGKHYAPGDLVKKHDTEDIFEALRQHTSKTEAELSDPGLWSPGKPNKVQYSTENDLVEYSSGSYKFSMPAPITKAAISIFGFNHDPKKPGFALPVNPVENRNFEEPVSEVNLNLSFLKPGKYEIHVNKEVKVIYYDPLLVNGNILGIIEIYNYLPGDNDYALLTDDEKIRKNAFRIQFPNRKVLWKYIRKDSKAQTITDIGDTGYEFNLNGDDFVSSIPIPLSEEVLKTLKLEFNTKDFRLFPLPNPKINRLAKYTQNDYDYLCSEVYLNY